MNDEITSLGTPHDEYDDSTPIIYQQPVRQFSRKVLVDSEDVDYVPDTSIRILYNNRLRNYAPHKHDALEICIPIENEYKYIIGTKSYTITPGDIFFIPPNTLHEIECENEGCRFIYLFNVSFLSHLFEYRFLSEFLKEPHVINEASNPGIYAKIYSAFMAINDQYFMYENMVLEMSIYSKLLEIFSLIATISPQFNPIRIEDAKRKDRYAKFRALINHINSHFMDEISLEWAADYVGFSKFHFARLFKDYTDVTFYDYLLHRRMQAAKLMLSDTDKTVTEIAFQSGFNNLTSFTRSFKNVTGLTPSQYRMKKAGLKIAHDEILAETEDGEEDQES
ncbi:MAG: AraC family transcriptional regulator [Clostridiales bacterium]|nr:AraC family transcriptional regulator [Clostridiales bacterium]